MAGLVIGQGTQDGCGVCGGGGGMISEPHSWFRSEIMACTQGLFSDSCRAVARELIRKQAKGCKLLFTIHAAEEIGINYN